VIENGVTTGELTEPYRQAGTDSLRATRDAIVRDAIARNMPGRLFNGLVYGALGDGDLARAMEFALLQARIDPSNANAWDTLGEVHYFLGDVEVARAYEEHSRRIDPHYSAGGEEVWKRDLEDFRKRWEEREEQEEQEER
jgi:hypothetical protein